MRKHRSIFHRGVAAAAGVLDADDDLVLARRSAVCEQAHWQIGSSCNEEPLCQWVHSTRLDESTVTVCRR